MRINYVIMLSLCFLFAFFGCATKEQPDNTAQSTGASVDNVSQVIKVERRPNFAPNFSWKDKSGNTKSLDSYKGNITFVNFWATWCGPCKHELPDLIELSKEFSNNKVTFIGVSVDRGPNIIDDVRAFVKEREVPYQNVLASDEMVEAYGNVRAIPTSFLINGEGKIVQTYIGIRSKEFLAGSIRSILN